MVEAAVPGMDPDRIEVTIEGDTLRIKGEVEREEETERADYIRRERQQSSFCRVLTLPNNLVSADAEAEFENGLLRLTIPKTEEVKPRIIAIEVK